MKALLFDPNKLGNVYVGERSLPKPKTDEVLIRINAASLNHRDLYVINGIFESNGTIIVGSDAAGVIESRGDEVDGWSVGDAVTFNPGFSCGECERCLQGDVPNCENHTVLGGPDDGVMAEYAVVKARYLVKKPAYLTFDETAALPMALGTAWRSLVTKGGLKAGETVLIQGIGGGVAYMAMQIAVKLGAKVIVTSSSDDKVNRAMQDGAFAGINYVTENVVDRVMEITNGVGVQVSLETGGSETLPITFGSLQMGGRIIQVGSTTGSIRQTSIGELANKQLSFIIGQMPGQPDLETALQFYEQHQLHPPILTGYSLEIASQAFEAYAQYKQLGKIVVSVATEQY